MCRALRVPWHRGVPRSVGIVHQSRKFRVCWIDHGRYASSGGNEAGWKGCCFMVINIAATMSGRLRMVRSRTRKIKTRKRGAYSLRRWSYSLMIARVGQEGWRICVGGHLRVVHYVGRSCGGQPMRAGQPEVRLKQLVVGALFASGRRVGAGTCLGMDGGITSWHGGWVGGA